MVININRRELVESLKIVLGPTTTKQEFPVLNSVLIKTEKGKVKFTTTDLDITISTLANTIIESEGEALVPMRKFISIARELSQQDVVLEKNKNILTIKCEKAEFKMNTIKEDEFPRLQEKKEAVTVKMLPETLEEMIRLTSFCAGYEDVNYVLGGVLFEIEENKIKLVATDGKRLACVLRDFPANQAEVKEKIAFILPSKAVAEIAKITKEKEEPLYLSFSQNAIEFDFGETKIISRPIEGEFPKYSQYIPKERGNPLTIRREEFIAALKRVGLFTTSEFQGVKLNLKKDKVTVYKTTPHLGEAKEEVEAQYQGAPLDIEFNPSYFLDALRQVTDPDVTVDFFGADKPAVLKSQNYTYLLLPIKN